MSNMSDSNPQCPTPQITRPGNQAKVLFWDQKDLPHIVNALQNEIGKNDAFLIHATAVGGGQKKKAGREQ